MGQQGRFLHDELKQFYVANNRVQLKMRHWITKSHLTKRYDIAQLITHRL